ncbi:MAG: type II secretion system GspH family protein [Candidatus Hydrogenedentes bacterium]|nr:type II secretion system GspH family protein [Candidatus Hydrogenedentota bacterium]
MNRRHHSRGFTLIEVLSAMAVLSILMLALLKLFNEATDAVKKGNNTILRSGVARSALDEVVRAIEGAVVDNKLACAMRGNFVDNDFDALYLVTTSGDPNDGRAYQLVWYFVSSDTTKGYTTYRLMRSKTNFDIAVANGVDPFTPAWKQWWRDNTKLNNMDGSPDMIADNIVRFDCYVHDLNGNNIAQGSPPRYDSSQVSAGGYPADKPFGYIDVYIQVASEDTMKRASYLRAAGNNAGLKRLLDQESNILIRRGIPLTGSTEMFHPLAN